MDEEVKEGVSPSHEEILKERDRKLDSLKSEIASNPEAEWRDFVVYEDLKVRVPAQAIIEAEALVQDASSHLELFRSGPQVLQDHGEIVLNPRNFGLIMSGIFEGNEDRDGLKTRITLQRGMSICEDKMEKLDYDPEKPGFNEVHKIYKGVEKVFDALAHLKPTAR